MRTAAEHSISLLTGVNNMTITVVCDVLGEENNGTTIAAMNLIRSLRAKGHTVRILCPDEKHRGDEDYYIVPTLNLGPLNNYVRRNGVCIAKGDREVIRKALDGADAVHIMTPFLLSNAALRQAKEMGLPVTAGFHCQAENLTSHLFLMNSKLANRLTYKVFYRTMFSKADAIHYPTEFIRRFFEDSVGAHTNGYVISNGVNRAFVRTFTQRPTEFEGKFIILFTGRYSKEKSHKILIDAAARSKHAEKIQLIFAGDGPLRDELIRYSGKLANPPVFRFFSREEMIEVINYADLYVHPAEIEIEAIACLEAISCGLVPVIADSPRCATKHFALGSNNLFRVNDPEHLAQRIDYWMEHPEEKEECSRRYLGYTKQFDHRSCMDRMEQMIVETAERTEPNEQKSDILLGRA